MTDTERGGSLEQPRTPDQILHDVGLNREMLKDTSVVYVGNGRDVLSGIEGASIEDGGLDNYLFSGKFVGKDGSVDYVVGVDNEEFHADPENEEIMDLLVAAVQSIKPMGEVRLSQTKLGPRYREDPTLLSIDLTQGIESRNGDVHVEYVQGDSENPSYLVIKHALPDAAK